MHTHTHTPSQLALHPKQTNRSHHYRNHFTRSFVCGSQYMESCLFDSSEKKVSQFSEKEKNIQHTHTLFQNVFAREKCTGITRVNSISMSSFSLLFSWTNPNTICLSIHFKLFEALTKRCQNEYEKKMVKWNKKNWTSCKARGPLHQFPRINYTMLNKYSCFNFVTQWCVCVSIFFFGSTVNSQIRVIKCVFP